MFLNDNVVSLIITLVPILRFPEFTDEWAALSVEDCLIRLENGANYDTSDVEGYPMSRIETISTSRIDYSKVGHSVNLKNAEHYRMLYGDILFSHINSVRHIGKTAYYEAEKPLYHGMNLLLLRCKSEIASKFIYYILNSQKFLRKCQVLAKQAVNQASISTSDLRKIGLFVPQYVEQERIAKFLSCIDDRINTQIRVIDKLKSLMQGLNNELMNNPKWDKVYVGDFMEFFPTNSFSWEQLNYDNGQVRNLHYGLIHNGLPTLVDCQKESLPYIQDSSLPKQYTACKDGDVAFADASEDTTEVGKVVELTNIGDKIIVCGLHTIHGRDVKAMTVKGFKGFAFNSKFFHDQLRRIAQGSKVYSINTDNLKSCYLHIPTVAEQQKIVGLLRCMQEKIEVAEHGLQLYKAQKQFLLRGLFV